jgi:hypothetical protein
VSIEDFYFEKKKKKHGGCKLGRLRLFRAA